MNEYLFIDGVLLNRLGRALGIDIDPRQLLRGLGRPVAFFYTTSVTAETVRHAERLGLSELELEEFDIRRDADARYARFLARSGFVVRGKEARPRMDRGEVDLRGSYHVDLTIDVMRLLPRAERIVVATGDGEFAPLLRQVADAGVRCDVVWSQESGLDAERAVPSQELLDAATEVLDIRDVLEGKLARGEAGDAQRRSSHDRGGGRGAGSSDRARRGPPPAPSGEPENLFLEPYVGQSIPAIVKFLKEDRLFGFLTLQVDPPVDEDVFFHGSGVDGDFFDLYIGQQVEVEIGFDEVRNRYQAETVRTA